MSDNITSKEQIILDNGIRRKKFWEDRKQNQQISIENSVYIMDFPVAPQIDHTKDLLEGNTLSIAGRINKKRTIGAVSFLKIMDHSQEIQLILKEENLKDYKDILDNLFYGDVVAVQ